VKANLKRLMRVRILAGFICAGSLGALAMMPAAAQATYEVPQYYWGCTYSWGEACLARYQHIEDQVTMDPDYAGAAMGYNTPTNDGYPEPKGNGAEWDVCGAAENPPGTLAYGWSCAYGIVYQWVSDWAYPAIGTAVPYYSIPLYQAVNWYHP
jgi:hypothetical protein